MPRFGIIALHLSLSLVLSVGLCFAEKSKPSGGMHISAKDQSHIRTAPKAFFPVIKHSFGEVFEGAEIKYDFVIKNQGNAPLVIKNIRPG